MMDSFETRLSMCRKCGLRELRVLLKGRGLVEEKEE